MRPFAGATFSALPNPVMDGFQESVLVELALGFLSCFLHPEVCRGDSIVCSSKNDTLQFLWDNKLEIRLGFVWGYPSFEKNTLF